MDRSEFRPDETRSQRLRVTDVYALNRYGQILLIWSCVAASDGEGVEIRTGNVPDWADESAPLTRLVRALDPSFSPAVGYVDTEGHPSLDGLKAAVVNRCLELDFRMEDGDFYGRVLEVRPAPTRAEDCPVRGDGSRIVRRAFVF